MMLNGRVDAGMACHIGLVRQYQQQMALGCSAELALVFPGFKISRYCVRFASDFARLQKKTP
jgi:hypothetical protein